MKIKKEFQPIAKIQSLISLDEFDKLLQLKAELTEKQIQNWLDETSNMCYTQQLEFSKTTCKHPEFLSCAYCPDVNNCNSVAKVVF